MIYGLYQSAAAMMTQEYRQGVIANNLANAETAGFKREIAVAAERIRADRAGIRPGAGDEALHTLTGGVWLAHTETDFGEGSMLETGNPFDVSLAGPGFFRVQEGDRTLLTRDGRFVADADGWIVAASDGAHVLGTGDAPLRINPRGGEVTIDEIGRLYQNRIEVGRLAVVDVADYDALTKSDASRFAPGEAQFTDTPALVMQGQVEQAGVEPVKELTSMIESARAYQMNAQMLTMQDQTAGRLISLLANA